MTSPFLQPAWTIEEVVLLVESSVNIATRVRDVESEVICLSERLRRGAGLSGLTVSARYRNEDDVRNNLKSMSSILKMIDFVDEEYLQGSTLGSVALYYRKHPDRYFRLLEKANQLYPVPEEMMQDEAGVKIDSDVSVDNTEESIADNIRDEKAEFNDDIVSYAEQVSDDEFTQIDTVSEGVTVYQSPRKRRPRISEGKASKLIDKVEFSSVFPQFSSNIVSQDRIVDSDSKIESMRFFSSRIKNVGEKTRITEGRNDIEETGKSDLSLIENRNNTLNNKLANIKEILVCRFRRGYRIGSALDRKRFREYYKSHFGKSIGASEEVVEGYIRNLGFEYDGKVYLADIVLSDDVRDRMCGFITDTLSTEKDYVFYEYLYERFRDEIESSITDIEMLRLYLKSLNIKGWIFRDCYIASSFDIRVSVRDELLSYMLATSDVKEFEQVKRDLAYLPSEELEYEWNHNKETLISNGRNERFHIGIFYCPNETVKSVASLIESGLKDVSFMTSEGLFEDIRLNIPELLANNEHISELGMRNALSRLLSRKFSFKNNIISKIRDSYDGPDAIVAFCKERGCFTLEEVDEVSTKIKCSLNFYLDKIYDVSIRVDDFNFVPRPRMNFDVKECDKALDLFVKRLFTPVRNIMTFDAFPSCGEYSWNKWILENYLLTSSKKYCLIRPKYLSKETVIGAIVRKDSPIKTYDDLIIQAIANSDIPIEEEAANEYLYEIGIINAKRKNGQVKKLLIKAREYRNRINKNKN